MDDPPTAPAPLVRSNEAARDIGAVVDWICSRQHVSGVALFGWATGGQWAGYYASINPGKVSHLVMLNSLYAGNSQHPLLGHGSDMEDPKHRGHFNQATCGGYRLNDAKSLLGAWDRSIPEGKKNEWRNVDTAKAYVETALASDPTSYSRNPPSFRSPCGAAEDSFYLATGRQLWDASLITAPTLVLASERDFWSRPTDRELLSEHLVHSPRVRIVVIPGATHFVHLDGPEHGRTLLMEEAVSFLSMPLIRRLGKAVERRSTQTDLIRYFERSGGSEGEFCAPDLTWPVTDGKNHMLQEVSNSAACTSLRRRSPDSN